MLTKDRAVTECGLQMASGYSCLGQKASVVPASPTRVQDKGAALKRPRRNAEGALILLLPVGVYLVKLNAWHGSFATFTAIFICSSPVGSTTPVRGLFIVEAQRSGRCDSERGPGSQQVGRGLHLGLLGPQKARAQGVCSQRTHLQAQGAGEGVAEASALGCACGPSLQGDAG